MPDWTEAIVSLVSAAPSKLCFVADLDSLLSAPQLREALERQALESIRYEDPVAFRYRYEAYLQDMRRRPDSRGVLVDVEAMPVRHVPYDLLHQARYVRIGFHQLFPKLNANALADLPRDDLDRVAGAYALYEGDVLGERATREFLLRDVYGVAPSVLTQRAALIGYLLRRHYARELLHALLLAAPSAMTPLEGLSSAPELFPFQLADDAARVAHDPRFSISTVAGQQRLVSLVG